MYSALEWGPLVNFLFSDPDFGESLLLARIIVFLLFAFPLVATLYAVCSKSKRVIVIIFSVLALLYGTNFLVLTIAVLIIFAIAVAFLDSKL